MAIAPVTPAAPPVAPVVLPVAPIAPVTVVATPKGRGISTRAIGIAILVIAVLYIFGLENLRTVGNNIGQRTVEVTDPNRPWVIPHITADTIFMVLVIAIAMAFIFKKGR